ncbi:hypothetical protein EB118_09580 [bacterium]|nr:hypothetical protein [bacterium]
MKAYEIVSERFIRFRPSPNRTPKSKPKFEPKNKDAAKTTPPKSEPKPAQIKKLETKIEDLEKKLAARSTPATQSRGLSLMKSAGGALVTLASAFGVYYYVSNYYEQITILEDAYAEAVKAAKENRTLPADHPFYGVPLDELKDNADTKRNALLGKAVFGVLMSAGLAGRFVSGFGKIVEFIPLIGIVGTAIRGLGAVLKIAEGPAALRLGLIYWLENSETGKEVMKTLVEWGFFNLVGYTAGKVAETFNKAAEEAKKYIEEKTGTKIPDLPPEVKDKVTTKIQTDPEVEKQQQAELDNIKYVNGVKATETGGYLRTDRDFYNNPAVIGAVRRALTAGESNPLDSIPKKPGFEYPTFILSLNRFS